LGQRIFGENRVQEIVEKHKALPKDIEWHFIGHLQSKKVKQIAPFVSLIHSVDSLKLLKTIDKEAKKNDRIIPVLLQFHIAQEDSKYGFSFNEIESLLITKAFAGFENVQIIGVMGMASFVNDKEQVREEFKTLKSYFDNLKENYITETNFLEVSMGMSGDYKLAIEEGSTMVRIGSLIFGARH